MANPIPNPIRALIIGTWTAALVCFENRRALRSVHRSKLRRDVRNIVIAAPAGAVMQAAEMPLTLALSEAVQRRGWGLDPLLSLPRPVRIVVDILLFDYTLYWWHYLTHRVPLLWRFHQVHHLDVEMDATTALRFHFGEITLSVAFRAMQVWLIGPAPRCYAAWQIFLFSCILFSHANVRLPL